MTRVSLQAVEGVRPLADHRIRATVVAAAEALGERTGVPCRVVDVDERSITVEVDGPAVTALGFAAELRRATNEWAVSRGHCRLWPHEPMAGDEPHDPSPGPEDGPDESPGDGAEHGDEPA